SPGIIGTAGAHFRKPDSGPARGTFAAARHQWPVGAKPLWRGYVGASASTPCTTVLSIGFSRAAAWAGAAASPGLLPMVLLAGSKDRSDLPPAGLGGVHQRQLDRRDPEQRDHRRLLSVAFHAVVVRCVRDAPDEASGRHRHRLIGIEVGAAV